MLIAVLEEINQKLQLEVGKGPLSCLLQRHAAPSFGFPALMVYRYFRLLKLETIGESYG